MDVWGSLMISVGVSQEVSKVDFGQREEQVKRF